MNQRQNVSSRPTAYPVMPWRYPPLFPRFDVPAIEYPNQNHQVVSQPASIVPVTYSAPDVRGPSFSGARHDMWFVDRSSDVRTTFSSSQWTLDRRQPWQPLIDPLRAPEGSWFHAQVPETDPCIICHPSSGIWNRTVPAPSPRDVPQPMDPLSNGHLLSFLDLLDKVNYLDVDQCSHETLALEPGKFFTNSRKVKQELADHLAHEFDEYCRIKKPMQLSARFFIRAEAAVLGRAMFYSQDAVLHLLTGGDGRIMCPYHTDVVKIEEAPDPHGGQADPEAVRRSGKLHCGCSQDDVILEMMLRKITVFPAGIEGQMSTMRRDFLNPRDRSFVCSMFRNWTGLSAKDMFRFGDDGKVRNIGRTYSVPT